MREQNIKKLEKQLQVFGLGMIQDFVTIFDVIKQNNITIQDIRDYINYAKQMTAKEIAKQKQEQERWNEKVKKCPKCNLPMRLTQGEDNDSIWTCMQCRFSIYNEQSMEKVLIELGVKI